LQDSSNVADLFGSHIVQGDIKPLLTYEEKLNNLTTKDITAVAKKFFKKSNSNTVILKRKIDD
jgi:predicted Zn-dependent peptidase